MGVASTLTADFGFWVKSPLKIHFTKHFLDIKDVTNGNTQFLALKFFQSLHGCGLCPEGAIRFLGEKSLKNALYKKFSRHKRYYKF